MNQELQMLEQGLPAAIDCLAPQGRLAVISFHSLEDRIVKRAFLKAAGKTQPAGDVYGPYLHLLEEQAIAAVKLVHKKPIRPGESSHPQSCVSAFLPAQCQQSLLAFQATAPVNSDKDPDQTTCDPCLSWFASVIAC